MVRRRWLLVVAMLSLVCARASLSSGIDADPPAAPMGVEASRGLYAGKVVVSYDTVTGATSYAIRRSQSSRKPSALLATDTDGQYEDTTALPGVRYLYWVDACNASGCSDTAASAQGYAAANPQPPTNLVATDGTFSAHVRLNYWPWEYEHVTYNVYRQTVALFDDAKPPIATEVEDTTYDDHTAAPDQIYWYWVTTVNVVGESAPSNSDTGFAGAGSSPTPGPSATSTPTRTPTLTRTPGPAPTLLCRAWLPMVLE